MKEKYSEKTVPIQPRKFGCGKGIFTYAADDFDETPPGFEEYTQVKVQNKKATSFTQNE
ncbi:MAG: hypothetical protein U7127_08065 [Phormidium sp.]